MPFAIQDRIYLQIRINNVEIPLDQNTIDYLHIVESVRIYLPMLSFKINDLTKFLTRNNLLVDGSLIEVTIEIEKRRSVYNFRLFSSSELITGGFTSYLVRGYLDLPVYWTGSSVTSQTGSASSVLQNICSNCGITYDGVTTADNQLWLPRNEKNCEFAKRVVERAWVSDTSCVKMFISADKRMVTRDVSLVAKLPFVQAFSNRDNSKDQTLVTDYEMVNRSGFNNSNTGYKAYQVAQSFLEDDQVVKDLQFTKNSRKAMINKAIQGELLQNVVRFAPIDVGNVSSTYERALYQNKRLSNLFSFGLTMVTPKPVVANVLDVVNTEISKPDLQGVEQYSGKFLLTTKVTYLTGINFYQKLEVMRHGINTTKDETQL
jgi:hypothetical protein